MIATPIRALPFLLILIACLAAPGCSQAETIAEWRARAEQGDAIAQYNLGVMYTKGEGVPRDNGEAVRWFRKAAQQGFSQAQYNLGVMYTKGEGVPRDDGEAVTWYRRAAVQGDAKAQFNLALMYDEGRGVPQDYVAAHKWFNLAASRLTGETREAAVHNRERLAARMTPAQIAEARRAARQWTREHP